MRTVVFAGGLGLGLLIGLSVPVWAHTEGAQVSALEARIAALESRIGVSNTRQLALSASDELRLTTGRSSLIMKKDGSIELKGGDILIDGRSVVAKDGQDTGIRGRKIGNN